MDVCGEMSSKIKTQLNFPGFRCRAHVFNPVFLGLDKTASQTKLWLF